MEPRRRRSGLAVGARRHRAAGNADGAAIAECGDEGVLGGRRLAVVWAQKVDRAAHRLGALDPKADQLAAVDLVGDNELADETDAEAGLNRALDCLVGVELPA